MGLKLNLQYLDKIKMRGRSTIYIPLTEISTYTKLDGLSKEEVVTRYALLEASHLRALSEIYRLKNENLTIAQLQLLLAEQLDTARKETYRPKSERYKKPESEKKKDTPKEPHKKKPSERYPNLPIKKQVIEMTPAPNCSSCGAMMTDSGMREVSEQLTVIPKKYEIIEFAKVKYRCSCHGCVTTAPTPLRIIPGSTYSDEMITDVVLSKYCDLIPIERYVAMAYRSGIDQLPQQSLIELTHQFAIFMKPVYALIREMMLKTRVLHADETPHRMLEGSEKKSWYLWGFSTREYCFLECHDTRSGDVASDILQNSKCEVLITDAYAGYGKAIRIANEGRLRSGKALIKNALCNAHARRYFHKTWPEYKEAEFYLDHYHEIYRLNKESKDKPPPIVLQLRAQMEERFTTMRTRALDEVSQYPNANRYGKALQYFLENYEDLTLFLSEADVSIDNNLQEGLLRNHVVGRKTWYGTHSPRGAETAAVLFTLVETCKLNHVNPRDYIKRLVQDMLTGKNPYTPLDFKTATPQ